jgi:hypothetical protein
MAVETTFFGLLFGHVLLHYPGHRERFVQWIPVSVAAIILSIPIHFGFMPYNKVRQPTSHKPTYLLLRCSLESVFLELCTVHVWNCGSNSIGILLCGTSYPYQIENLGVSCLFVQIDVLQHDYWFKPLMFMVPFYPPFLKAL